ncbi:MAG: hypothetical protein SFX19_00935 [Alphaproteobacteria bacterium]|nr:hypothetical protein [Alphaproteobacteria bacterium]
MAEEDELKKDIVCNEPIPSLFIDGFQGMGIAGGTVRVNLIEDRLDSTKQKIVRHVVTRLIMPTEVLNSFIERLTELRDKTQAATEDGKENAAGK